MKELSRKPILFGIVVILAMLSLTLVVIPVLQVLLWENDSMISGSVYVCNTLAVVFLSRRCGRRLDPDFRLGIHRQNLRKSMTLCLPMLLESLFSVWLYLRAGCPGGDGTALLLKLMHAVQAGITEEVVFRGLILTNLVHQWRGKQNGKRKALLAASVLFCLTHSVNLMMGQSAQVTSVQICYTFSVGCLAGTAYLLTGNLLGPILIHTLHNCVALGLGELLTDPLNLSFTTVGVLLICKLCIYWLSVRFALRMLRKLPPEDPEETEAASP